MSRIEHRELAFVAAIVAALLVITALPYVYGIVSSPPEKQFMGVLYDVHDTAQYLSWMRESGQRLFIENKLTSEPNLPRFLNLQWWLIGRVARVLRLSLIWAYHLFRVVAIVLFVVVSHRFCGSYFSAAIESRPTEDVDAISAGRSLRARLLPERGWQARVATLVLAFGGGIGWIWVVVKQFVGELLCPIDVYTIPGNAFFSLMGVPHVAFAATLITITVWLGFLAATRAAWRYTIAAGVMALILGMSHIYDLVTVWAVLAALGLLFVVRDGFSWGLFGRLTGIVAISLPAPLYYGYLAYLVPVWKEALQQFDNLQTFTPSPIHLLIFLGLPLWMALFTLPDLLRPRRLSPWQVFVRGWLVTSLVLIYLPLKFQIMLLNGIQIPTTLLAVELLYERILPWIRKRLRHVSGVRLVRWAGLAFVVLTLPLNLYLFAWRFVDLRRADYPYYLYRDDVAALAWLESHGKPDEVVLASLEVGHYLPGLTGKKAFYSSGVMTLDFVHKRQLVERFFSADASEDERRQIVETYGIDYVLHGPSEHEMGGGDPFASEWLELVYEGAYTRLYSVKSSG